MSKNSMSSNKTVLLLSLLVVVTLCQLQTVFTASFSLETDGQTFGDIDEVVVNELSRDRRGVNNPNSNPVIKKLHITSHITSRFATTKVTTVLKNNDDEAREVMFKMKIPESAFMTNFTVEIGNKTYVGVVKEKAKAQQTYDSARERGQTAGHVVIKERETDTFAVSMNVRSGGKAKFVLTYQELLFRRRGIYEHRITIKPHQIIYSLKVRVFLTEPQGIAFIQVPDIQTNAIDRWSGREENSSYVDIVQETPGFAHVTFNPSPQEQEAIATEDGIMGDFVVRYDVNHEFNAGELQILGSYFVHHFAPIGIPPANKNVIFIIDTSGSMDGRKLTQTKTAMKSILADMRPGDMFNIVTFSNDVRKWLQNGLVPASHENVYAANWFINHLSANGGTNINQALTTGALILHEFSDNTITSSSKSASLLILLTDGLPTVGQTNQEEIADNFASVIEGQGSLFCLGFGNDVDQEFLEKLSLRNRGVGKKIFEDADASLQLKGFYDEIANPILFDVHIRYSGNIVDMLSLTRTKYPVYFDGSEIVVAGKLNIGGGSQLQAEVTGNWSNGVVLLAAQTELQDLTEQSPLDKEIVESITERLWVYLTIKQLFEEIKLEENDSKRQLLEQKIVDLSLKYNFVTKLTSMVVVEDSDASDVLPTDRWDVLSDSIVMVTLRQQSIPVIDTAHYNYPAANLMVLDHSFRRSPIGPNRARSSSSSVQLSGAGIQRSFLPSGLDGKHSPSRYKATTTSKISSTVQTTTTEKQKVSTTVQATISEKVSRHQTPGYFIIGGFNGTCTIGVKLNNTEAYICFQIPNTWKNDESGPVTLLDFSDRHGGRKVYANFNREGNSNQPCWRLTSVMMPTDEHSREYYQRWNTQHKCQSITLLIPDLTESRLSAGLLARVLDIVHGIDLEERKDDVVENTDGKFLYNTITEEMFSEATLKRWNIIA
ncbi:inter-alpha-trypsin inhibitor heavy chain H4-like isoform X2 [Glandiceps talaboti]